MTKDEATPSQPNETHALLRPASWRSAPTGDFWVERPIRISAAITGSPTKAIQTR